MTNFVPAGGSSPMSVANVAVASTQNICQRYGPNSRTNSQISSLVERARARGTRPSSAAWPPEAGNWRLATFARYASKRGRLAAAGRSGVEFEVGSSGEADAAADSCMANSSPLAAGVEQHAARARAPYFGIGSTIG